MVRLSCVIRLVFIITISLGNNHFLLPFCTGIEPWTFVQNLGDAVFIPAGCPHQVRNLKVTIVIFRNWLVQLFGF